MKERYELAGNAFKVNGTYFEDVIQGYHTLNTTGRETLEKTLNFVETDADGSKLISSRFPQREIEVEFLITSYDYDFESKFETLMSYCNVENAQIIFNDEPDKFLIGTIVAKDIEKTRFTHSGKLAIFCADPFKYSVTEYEVSADNGQWVLNYDGAYKSYPTFLVNFPLTLDANGNNTNTSECGYIGFADARGDVLQFGDPEATDWADVTQPATNPLNKTFKSVSDWTLNDTKLTSTGFTQTGTVGASSYAYPTSYGSGSNYHGPALSKILTDVTAATNFEFTWKQKFAATKAQFGAFECLLWNNDNGTRTLIGGVSMRKTTKNTKTTVYYYANNSLSNKYNFSCECSKIGTSSIKKQGSTVTISVAGVTKSFTLSDDTLIINEVSFWFGKNGSKTSMGANYLYSCSLKRFAYTRYEDVKNIFQPGDTLKVNCKDASVTLDSGDAETNAQTIGALGNDWEKFYLAPGSNVIAFDYSDFTTTPPLATMKYRKVYL